MSSVPVLPYNERRVICLLCSAMPAVLLSSGLRRVLVAQVHLPLLFVTSHIEVAVSSLCALWGHHPAHPQFFLKRHFPAVREVAGSTVSTLTRVTLWCTRDHCLCGTSPQCQL